MNKCAVCGKEGKTVKHHLAHTPEEIVVQLCVECHKKVHHGFSFWDSVSDLAQIAYSLFGDKDSAAYLLRLALPKITEYRNLTAFENLLRKEFKL